MPDTRQPESGAFTLRAFRVAHGRPAVIDDGGPIALPQPSPPGAIPPLPPVPPLPAPTVTPP